MILPATSASTSALCRVRCAQEFDAPLELGRLVEAVGDRLGGKQPDLDDRRHRRGAALLRRQARELLVEVAERQLEVGFA